MNATRELGGLVRLELLKLWTTGTSYAIVAIACALTAADAALRASRAGNKHIPPLNTADGLTTVATLTGFAMLMAMVLGATVSSGEFRHATASLTYLQCPDRARVMVAKILTAGLAGLLMGALGAGLATGVGLAFVAGHGYGSMVSAATLTHDGVGALLGAALLAMLGAAIGSLLRSQLAVTLGSLVWALFVESIVGGLFNSIGPYLPFTAATTLGGASLGSGGFGFADSSSADALPFAGAAALVAGIATTVAILAAGTAVRADIT